MKITPVSNQKEIFNNGHYHFFPGRRIESCMPLWIKNNLKKREIWIDGWNTAAEEYTEMEKKNKMTETLKRIPATWKEVQELLWETLRKRRRILSTHPELFKLLDNWYNELISLREMNQQ